MELGEYFFPLRPFQLTIKKAEMCVEAITAGVSAGRAKGVAECEQRVGSEPDENRLEPVGAMIQIDGFKTEWCESSGSSFEYLLW